MDGKDLALGGAGFFLPFLGSIAGTEAYLSGDRLAAKALPATHTTEQLSRLREIMGIPKERVPVFHDMVRYRNPPPSGMLYNIDASPKRIANALKAMDLMDADSGRRLFPGVTPYTAAQLSSGKPAAAVFLRDTKEVATLAHELGHATMTNKGLVGKLRGVSDLIGRRIASTNVRAFPLRYGIAASPIFMDADNPYLYAPAAVLAASELPLLAEEAVASTKGLGALKKLMGAGEPAASRITKPQYAAARKVLARMFGSYALPALAMSAAPLALAALKKRD